MPDIIGALLQERQQRQQDSAAVLKSIAAKMEQERLGKLGQEFIQSWDGTPESAMKFAVAKGLNANEYAGILQMVKAQQEVGPKWKETQVQDESGNILKRLYDQNNPQKIMDLGVSQRPKNEFKEVVNPADWSKQAAGFNPYSNKVTPIVDQSGAAVTSERPPTYLGSAMSDEGTPLQGQFLAATGAPQGAGHVSGRSMEQDVEIAKAKAEAKADATTGANLEKYPNVAEAMATGWMPSGRVTGPMLEIFEAAMRQAKENGEPLTKEKLFDMEFNARKNSATGATAGGRITVARKQNINTAFQLLDDMEVTNKKLGYSDARLAGEFEKFVNGQSNDPIFTEYMTQRADALFVLGNALKQNGLTDKSIEVEEEAANPTLSPRAFQAWVNAQRRALNKAAGEMNKDFKYDIKTQPTTPAGQGGAGMKTIEGGVKSLSDEELMRSLGL